MLHALWRGRWYWLLGFFAFLITLVVTAPLHFLWPYVQPQLPPLPVKIQQVSGTLWDGQAQLTQRQVGQLDVNWQLSPWSLLTGVANLNLAVTGNGVRLQGQAQANVRQQLTLSYIQGYLDANVMSQELRRNQVSLVGNFELSQFNARFDGQARQLLEATGQLVFSGGPASFLVNRKTVNVEMPMLVAQISRPTEQAEVNIATVDGEAIGQAFLQNDGWGGVALRRRFLDIVEQPWPGESTPDTIIFEVSQKVL